MIKNIKHHVFDKELFLVFPPGETERFQKPRIIVLGTLRKELWRPQNHSVLCDPTNEHLWAMLPSKVEMLVGYSTII